MKNATHNMNMARGGYDWVEVREMEKKMKEHQQIIDPPSPLSPHQRWKLGHSHTKNSNEISSDAAREIVNKIDELEEQCAQGTFVFEGRHDILATVFGRREHRGSVYGVGFGMGFRDYSERSSHGSESLISEKMLEQLKKKITHDVTQNIMKQFGHILNSPGVHSQQPQVDIGTPDDVASSKGSCTDIASRPSREETWTGDDDRFGFYVDERPPRLVAIGRVHQGGSTLHCAPLVAHLVNVVVEEPVDAGAKVPVPTEEVNLVGEALGGFIAWPKHLVVANYTKDIEQTERPKKQARHHDWSRRKDDIIKELLSVASSLFGNPLQVPWDTTIFGCDSDVPLYISHNDLLEIVHGSLSLGISVIQFWILYLSKLNVGPMDDDLYGYLKPQSMQNMGSRGDDTSGYISKYMCNSKKQVYFGAYHHDRHWQLLIIVPAKGVVVWLCSLHRKPGARIKAVVQNVVTSFKMLSGMHTSKSKQAIRWIIPKCNKQVGGWECGYYVMHWMSTIVRARIIDGWVEMFDDDAALLEDSIYKIRIEWAQHFLEFRNRLSVEY